MATRCPTGLKTQGRRLWREVTTEFELNVGELRVLEQAARELDLIDRMDKTLAAGDLFVKGSKDQDVPNPLLAELRQHRSAFAAIMAKLELPGDEPPASSPGSRSAAAREMAAARWRRSA